MARVLFAKHNAMIFAVRHEIESAFMSASTPSVEALSAPSICAYVKDSLHLLSQLSFVRLASKSLALFIFSGKKWRVRFSAHVVQGVSWRLKQP